ncbi:MAG: aminotransferase class I/II-fold pyridoxal phosphate-dependent enzyme [Muribaculaceae bacterium]|nr:aminotransferase class I/II-fold pyridoxal phosphate-dependent enzyme [Muribaculaceae bacterium]
MIEGHGDDTYRYDNIRKNFSSNIFTGVDLSALYHHLDNRMDVISSYPEPSAASLERMIARECCISPDEVLVTSGAVDAIYLIAQTYRHLGTCHILTPTFREYEDACRVFGYKECEEAALCWLCNPNNPTGSAIPPDEVMALAGRHAMLIVDQSYENYTQAPMLNPAQAVKRTDVILLHSMTKQYAVPGLRLGYVTASSSIIRALREQYRPWAINALSLEAGKWLVENNLRVIPDLNAYLDETQRLRKCLNMINGIEAHDTVTSFFLCTIEQASAAELKEYLAREHGILIRDASNFTGLTPHHFRIATQSPPENDTLVEAIRQFTSQWKNS